MGLSKNVTGEMERWNELGSCRNLHQKKKKMKNTSEIEGKQIERGPKSSRSSGRDCPQKTRSSSFAAPRPALLSLLGALSHLSQANGLKSSSGRTKKKKKSTAPLHEPSLQRLGTLLGRCPALKSPLEISTAHRNGRITSSWALSGGNHCSSTPR